VRVGKEKPFCHIGMMMAETVLVTLVPEGGAGRSLEAAKGLLAEGLQATSRSPVEAVSVAMWPAFAAAFSARLPEARIACDPFHVVSHASATYD
jgi:hypothetical protein